MTLLVSRRSFLLALALSQIELLPRRASSAESAVGAVSDIKGEAFAELRKKRRNLSVKSSLFLSDRVNTGKQSRLVARLARKTILRLGAETVVRIDKFLVEAGGEISLGGGALFLDIPASAIGRGLRIESPFALIAVRGTRFFAGSLDRAFSVFVVRGAVDVAAGGKTVRLRAGEGTDIARPGSPPGPVKKWGSAKIAKAMALVG
jgi:ferric-dicitrate binding protein FerR (iron transport regulator)